MPNPVYFLVLVAGYEYSTKRIDFDLMCTHRVNERIHVWHDAVRAKATTLPFTPPVTLRFLRFYFKTGVIQFIDHDIDATGGSKSTYDESSWQPISAFSAGGDPKFNPQTFCTNRTMRAITPADYQPGDDPEYSDFQSDTPNVKQVMSIVDVYQAVQKMPASCLLELSFFSHGYVGGPILVNSSEDDGTPSDARDPLDKDGRAKKDFLDTMGTGTATNVLALFHGSFTSDGFLQAWGCFAPPGMRHVLSQAYIKRKHQPDAVGQALNTLKPVDDTATFDFDFSDVDHFLHRPDRPWTNDYKSDKKFFPPDTTTKTFTRTFLQIKQFLARHNARGYVYHAAKNAVILAKGAFFGMEGDPEPGGFRLMRVCVYETYEKPQPACPVGYSDYLQFHNTYLTVKFDRDRGYAIWDDDAVLAVDALLP